MTLQPGVILLRVISPRYVLQRTADCFRSYAIIFYLAQTVSNSNYTYEAFHITITFKGES